MYYDVVLVNPPLRGITGYEHIGLEYIASFLRKNGISVKVIDPRLQKIPPAKAVSDILDWNPKIVGVSIPFQDYVFDSIRFITQMRKFGIK
ncbi:MAG: cobalamin-dependent protein, partial [Thermotogaceae bacterium]|nr:cobalamin-dependent protein [Thermotogaceae bacterium]